MPVVVSDTSPIRASEFVAYLDVLPVLFDRVLVPPAVATELARSGGRYRHIDVSNYPFLEVLLLLAKQRGLVKAVRPLVDQLRDELGFFVSDTLRGEILRRAGEAS